MLTDNVGNPDEFDPRNESPTKMDQADSQFADPTGHYMQ
jgi:hypothetical protein